MFLNLLSFAKFSKFLAKFEIAELCKGVHCVDLGESFQTHIFLQNLASIQPRTSPFKFARSPRTDPPGALTVLFGCLGYGFPVRDTTVKNPDSDDEDDQHEMVGRHLQHNMLEDEEDDVELKPGAAVEYYSETRREWFPATILSVDPRV